MQPGPWRVNRCKFLHTHTDNGAEKIPAKVAHPDRSGAIRGQMLWKHERNGINDAFCFDLYCQMIDFLLM